MWGNVCFGWSALSNNQLLLAILDIWYLCANTCTCLNIKHFYLWWYFKPELLGIANRRQKWNGHIWKLFPWCLVIVPTHHLSTYPKLIWHAQLQVCKHNIRTTSFTGCQRTWLAKWDGYSEIFLITGARQRAVLWSNSISQGHEMPLGYPEVNLLDISYIQELHALIMLVRNCWPTLPWG